MNEQRIIINNVDVSECEHVCVSTSLFKEKTYVKCSAFFLENNDSYCDCTDNPNCYFKQLKHKEQECFELANVYHYLVKIANNRLNKIKDLQQQFDQLKTKNEGFKRRITKIFACLIKANRTNKIVDTIWVDNITTLWDYIALTLGIEGDQVQIEKQILQKNEVLNGTNP